MDNPEKLATFGTQEKEKQQNIQFEVISWFICFIRPISDEFSI